LPAGKAAGSEHIQQAGGFGFVSDKLIVAADELV